MMGHFRMLAGSAAHHPDRRLSKLSMLSDAERTQLLAAERRGSLRCRSVSR